MRILTRDIALGCSASLILLSLLACSVPKKKTTRPDEQPRYKSGTQPFNAPPAAASEPRDEYASPRPEGSAPRSEARLVAAPDAGTRPDKTPIEARCDAGEAKACHEFAVSTLKVSTDPSMTSKAAMAMFRACDMEHKLACYDYALMVWMQVGVEYDGQEIAFSLERARRLKDRRANNSYEELIRPPAPGTRPRRETMAHYKNACALSLLPACRAIEALSTREVAVAKPEETSSPEGLPVIEPSRAVKVTEIGLSVAGGIPAKTVEKALVTRKAQLKFCFERGLEKNPELMGTFVTTVTVKPDGYVAAVSLDGSSIQDREVLGCMEKFVKLWKFDAPSNKKETLIVYMAEFASE